MLCFVALIWNERNPSSHAAAERFKSAFIRHKPTWLQPVSSSGFTVFCFTSDSPCVDDVYVLQGDRGVVLGRLFELDDRGISRSVPSIPQHHVRAIEFTAGRHLIDHYWGRYVAFVLAERGAVKCVLRDPSGVLSCLYMEREGVTVYFHRIQDLEPILEITPSINRRYLLGRLLYNSVCVTQTGIVGVNALLPGQRVLHDEERREVDFVWNPTEIAGSDEVTDVHDAVRMTRQTVRGCVDAWAGCFDGILHRLSGGLDSNIVLSCLRDAPTKPRLAAINEFYTSSATANDRRLADMASQRSNCEIIHWESNAKFRIPRPDRPTRSASPVLFCVDIEARQRLARLARDRGYSAVFSGNGGDEIFYRGGRFPTAADYLWMNGVSTKLLQIVLDDARYTNVSFWRVLKRTLTSGSRRKRWAVRDMHPRSMGYLLTDSIMREAECADDLWHPLFSGVLHLPPAKLDQAYLLTFGSSAEFNPYNVPGSPVGIAPLMSQPIIELSLRTPVHVLRSGGRDRAVARMAFASELLPDISLRKKTAEASPYFESVLRANVDTFRDFLLDGFLVQNGYLDHHKLNGVLTGSPTVHPTGASDLLRYMDIEAWCRGWATSQ